MSCLAKFKPDEPVWVLSDGVIFEPGKYAGSIVRQKNSGHYMNDEGQLIEVEVYAVKIPELPTGLWVVSENCLRPRVQDVRDPPGMSDHDPNGVTSWDRCEWKPGKNYGQGKIYVPS